MITTEITNRVSDKIEQCYQIVERAYNRKFPRCSVAYDVRGTVGGMAMYRANLVRFNPVLLSENVDAFISRTVPHEVAHLVTKAVFPYASAHGREWKSVMVTLGADPTRCHDYDVTNAQVKTKTKYHYTCGCADKAVIVSAVIHNRIQRGRTYTCRTCRHPVRFFQTIGQVNYKQAHQQAQDREFVSPANQAADRKQAVKAPRAGTKLDMCYKTYKTYKHDRKLCIAIFIQEHDCTKAGANTYWSTCQKMDQEGV